MLQALALRWWTQMDKVQQRENSDCITTNFFDGRGSIVENHFLSFVEHAYIIFTRSAHSRLRKPKELQRVGEEAVGGHGCSLKSSGCAQHGCCPPVSAVSLVWALYSHLVGTYLPAPGSGPHQSLFSRQLHGHWPLHTNCPSLVLVGEPNS